MALLPLLYALFFAYEIEKNIDRKTSTLLIFLDSQRNYYAINEFCINR